MLAESVFNPIILKLKIFFSPFVRLPSDCNASRFPFFSVWRAASEKKGALSTNQTVCGKDPLLSTYVVTQCIRSASTANSAEHGKERGFLLLFISQ